MGRSHSAREGHDVWPNCGIDGKCCFTPSSWMVHAPMPERSSLATGGQCFRRVFDRSPPRFSRRLPAASFGKRGSSISEKYTRSFKVPLESLFAAQENKNYFGLTIPSGSLSMIIPSSAGIWQQSIRSFAFPFSVTIAAQFSHEAFQQNRSKAI